MMLFLMMDTAPDTKCPLKLNQGHVQNKKYKNLEKYVLNASVSMNSTSHGRSTLGYVVLDYWSEGCNFKS